MRGILLATLGIALTAGVGLSRAEPQAQDQTIIRIPPAPARAPGYSNIHAGDYVGSETCAECHQERHLQWTGNRHRAMNRLASEPGAVMGDFDGSVLSYAGGEAVFDRDVEGPRISLLRDGEVVRRYRVTRTIGSRYIQEYVGLQIAGPEPTNHPLYWTEHRLPFGYWMRPGRWVPRSYHDDWYGEEVRRDGSLSYDPFVPDDEPWDGRCAWCHNTFPFEVRLHRRPEAAGLDSLFQMPTLATNWAARVLSQRRVPLKELVSVGISCESCHFGGREHALDEEPISFYPRSPQLTAAADMPDLSGGRRNNQAINLICAQCHASPGPHYSHGGSTRASNEAMDFMAGSCASEAKCTDCHDPHRDGPGAMAADQTAHIEACTGCHPSLADAAAAQVHSGHAAADASCLDCHMPRMVQGFSHVVRSHRISSPNLVSMLAEGEPNACNLCHLDRSVEWTLAALDQQFGSAPAPDAGWDESYAHGLGAPVGASWLDSDDPLLRVTAAAAYADSPLGPGKLPDLLARLDDDIAYHRMRMLFAVEEVLGRPLAREEYDPLATPDVRRSQASALRARHGAGTLVVTPR